jgi:hypothetical protein
MNYYFAPMEGVTTAIYRRAHAEFFPGCDRYYAPFLVACQSQASGPGSSGASRRRKIPGWSSSRSSWETTPSRSSPRRRCCGTWALMRSISISAARPAR